MPLRRPSLSVFTLLALTVATAAAPLRAAGASGRLEGLLLGTDGRPARGYAVHLIDPDGAAIARAPADDDGLYVFRAVEPGDYGLGIEVPDGRMAPVGAPPVHVAADALVRRDVKLLTSDPAATQQAALANYGIGYWWKSLSRPAQIWTIVGTVLIVGITVAALDNGDSERLASPM